MRTHSQIVREANKRRIVAEKCGVSIHAVGSWITRCSIPAEHFKLFSEQGWATLDELADGAAKQGSEAAAA